MARIILPPTCRSFALVLHFENERFNLTTNFDMKTNINNTTEPQHDAKLPVVGSASRELVDCADCDYRHDKTERVKKKGKVWTTYHCPKCGSELTCRVS